MTKQAGMKLFIGAPLSMEAVRAVAKVAEKLRARADTGSTFRWVAPARYHVTLKYLGWTREEAVPAIRDRVAEVVSGVGPFEIQCRELGAFPSLETARVLWAGIADEGGQLTRLAEGIDEACAELGFPAETRPYHSHLTLARLRPPTNAVSLVQEEAERLFSKSVLKRLILYKSSVESVSSEYEHVATWPLE